MSNYYDTVKKIQYLDERREALKSFAQYTDTVQNIERLIAMFQATLEPDHSQEKT